MIHTIRKTKCKFVLLEETEGSIFLLFSEICLYLFSVCERAFVLTAFDFTEVFRHGVLQCQSKAIPAAVIELRILDADPEVQQFGFDLGEGGTVHSHLE